jgi:hypothetical protein
MEKKKALRKIRKSPQLWDHTRQSKQMNVNTGLGILRIREESYEMVLDELNGQGTLAYTTTTDNYKLVFSHSVYRMCCNKGGGVEGGGLKEGFFGWFYASGA